MEKDRLSELPDHLILQILSFLFAKQAVQTCILSKRFDNLWKRLPTLRLTSSSFKHLKDFTKFVSKILSLRDHSTSLHSLTFHRHSLVEPHLLKRVLKYAVSHNVEQIYVRVKCDIQHFPPTLFSSHTLTSLKLALVHPKIYAKRALFPTNSINLPSLTTLCLHLFAFSVNNDGCAEPFSIFNKLNTLVIDKCEVEDSQNLWISSATLVKLTIVTRDYPPDDCIEIELSTPNLCTFTFIGSPFHKLYGSKTNLASIKHVDIDVNLMASSAEYSSFLLNWLIQLTNIKSLTLSSPTLQVLFLVSDLLKVELSSLSNLKSLKVMRKKPSSIPDGIVDFLIQNSPSAKVDIIEVDIED
ncbi:putative F-box domain, leucine-rich repeat domain, L domain-containing protein [Medicago truncatula]|nr:putative F-box domain, leucine-rich repeat domain, L domain-containing protein [Medicago truncatula]